MQVLEENSSYFSLRRTRMTYHCHFSGLLSCLCFECAAFVVSGSFFFIIMLCVFYLAAICGALAHENGKYMAYAKEKEIAAHWDVNANMHA